MVYLFIVSLFSFSRYMIILIKIITVRFVLNAGSHRNLTF